jgi:hypothetical protein
MSSVENFMDMNKIVFIQFVFLYYLGFGQSSSCQSYNNNNPFNPSFSGTSTISCGTSTSITCSASNSIWYAQATGGSPISSNNILTVSPTSTTTYYVQRETSLSQTTTFNYTGNQQTWTVPIGVNSINVIVVGAKGSSGNGTTNNGTGGLGGKVQATIPVTPGQTLYFNVGGTPSCTSCSGWNGGGVSADVNAGGGGGASDIRIGGTSLSNRVIVAAGGGGGGCWCFNSGFGNGGNGGGLNGSDANYPFGSTYSSYYGHGGTQSSGGLGGAFVASTNGSLGQGGSGYLYGAGGGGGYYGGGGGSQDMGGGGGSSFAYGSATSVFHVAGYNSSNGYITISYTETCVSSRIAKTITVNSIPAPPTPTINAQLCNAVTLNAISSPNGITYYWQGTNATGTSTTTSSSLPLSISSSGTYYLRALNTAGCWSSASSISIVVPGFPSSPNNPTISSTTCSSATITRAASPPNGVTYYWQGTNPSGTNITLGSGPTYIATATGVYFIRAKFNNYECWSSSSGSIAINLDAPNTPTTPTSNSPQCDLVTLSQNGNAPSGETWYWQGTNSNGTSTSSSATTINVSTSGTYYLRSRNSNGCWSVSSSNLTVVVSGYPSTPTALSSNSPNCSNVNISYNNTPPSGVTWYWQGTNSNGTSTSIGSNSTYIVNNSGTYYLRAFKAPNCWSSNSSNISITVLNPSSANVNITECGGYTAPNGAQYTSSGQYQANIPNYLGCDSIININLTINPIYSVFDTVFACESYTWINGTTYDSTIFNVSHILTSNLGCDSTVYLNLYIGHPSQDTTFLQISAINNFEWNGITYSENGQYFQTLVDHFGCDSTISIELFLEFSNINEQNNSDVQIFPIPSENGIFHITGNDYEVISVMNILGNNINAKYDNGIINLSGYAKGTYFVQLRMGNLIQIQPLIFF